MVVNYRAKAFCSAGALILALLPASFAMAQAQRPVVRPPQAVGWYGDPSAPNISGVWVLSGPAAKTPTKEGWLPWPAPLKGEYAKTWAARKVAKDADGGWKDDPVRACLPPGMPRYMTGTTTPLLIIQTPGRVTMYRDNSPVRRIWLDGRVNAAAADLEAFSNGNSIAHYEGGALVTKVEGLRTDYPIETSGLPHSEALVIEERITPQKDGTLLVDETLTDKDAFSRPMHSSVIYRPLNDPKWEPREFLCKPKTDYHPEAVVR